MRWSDHLVITKNQCGRASHAVTAIKVASTLMNLPQYQNVMDHRWLGTVWHLHTWRAEHTGVIKRVSLAGVRSS